MIKLLNKIKSWFSKEKTTIDLRVEALVEKYVSELKGDAKAELRALIEDVKDEVRKERVLLDSDVNAISLDLGVEKNRFISAMKKFKPSIKITL